MSKRVTSDATSSVSLGGTAPLRLAFASLMMMYFLTMPLTVRIVDQVNSCDHFAL